MLGLTHKMFRFLSMIINVERRGSDGVVALVRICRPKTRNALERKHVEELMDELARLNADQSVSAIVITGCDEAFSAGADVQELVREKDFGGFAAVWTDPSGFPDQWIRVAQVTPNTPVIAAVNGWALGGGFGLALASDIIYAGSGARFAQPAVKIGTTPTVGVSQRLPRIVGKSLAMEACLTGGVIDAEEALRRGLVSKVFPSDQVVEEAIRLGEKIASHKSPHAVQAIKMAINNAWECTSLQNSLEMEGCLRASTDAVIAEKNFKESDSSLKN